MLIKCLIHNYIYLYGLYDFSYMGKSQCKHISVRHGDLGISVLKVLSIVPCCSTLMY